MMTIQKSKNHVSFIKYINPAKDGVAEIFIFDGCYYVSDILVPVGPNGYRNARQVCSQKDLEAERVKL